MSAHLSPLVALAILLSVLAGAVFAKESIVVRQLFENDQPELPSEELNVVEVDVYIRNFEYLSSIERKFKVQLLLRMKWLDERLQDRFSEPTNVHSGIWMPDLFFRNELKTVEQRTLQARVNRYGEVLYQRRISVELSCPMDLRNYPFDTQECPLILSSWSTPESRLQLRWSSSPLRLNTHARDAGDFRLKTFETKNCSLSTTVDVFSCLRGDFFMERMTTPYLLRVFVPLSMCVLISCFSFWIACSPVRVTLLMVDFMGTMLLIHFTTYASPITNYTKYIDIFTGVALTFIMFALLEFIVVQYVYKRELMNEKVHSMMNDLRSNWIDILCRLLTPLLFLIFVIVYFTLALM